MNSTKSAFLKRLYNPIYRSASMRVSDTLAKKLRRLIELTSVSAEQAVDNINVALIGKAFHGTPVFVSEFTRSVRLWAIIRSYHLIEITIAIAVGVYLWLK